MIKYLLFAASLLATPAMAHPTLPKPGDVITIPFKVIVCDTKEEIADIAKAGAAGDPEAVTKKLNEYESRQDSKNEPSCSVQHIVGAVAGESADTGPSTTAAGQKVETFAIELTGNPIVWMMFAVAFDEAPTIQKERSGPAPKLERIQDLCEGHSQSSKSGVGEPRLFWCAADTEEATPSPAAECTTLADIKDANPKDARFVPLTVEEFTKILAHFVDVGNPAPERVKSIVLGALANNDTTVWVFAFDKDKCETAHFNFSASAMKAILSGN